MKCKNDGELHLNNDDFLLKIVQVAQGNTTHQLMHFVSYVLGAAGVQHLPPGQPHVNTA